MILAANVHKNTRSPCQKRISAGKTLFGGEVAGREPEFVAQLCSHQQRRFGLVYEQKAWEAADWVQASSAAAESSGASVEATISRCRNTV